MKVAFGCDIGGWEMSVALKQYLTDAGYEWVDLGMKDADNMVWYFDAARNVATAVTSGQADKGILVCGTGMGISIAANKNKGARCALVESVWTTKQSRIVNDANIVAFGGTNISYRIACEIIDTFLNTEFTEGCEAQRAQNLRNGKERWLPYEDAVFK